MIFYAVGAGGGGKSHYVREYVLPTLLTRPGLLTEDAPPGGFRYVLVDDPRSGRHPAGQYPGRRMLDASEWRRAASKPLVACFDDADPEELARLAYQVGNAVVVLDEVDLRLGHESALGPWTVKLLARGRHDGVALVGTMKRLASVQTRARTNCQFYLVGQLSDDEDRLKAAKTVGVHPDVIARLPRRVFVEYRRETGEKYLTTVENGRRVVLQRL